MTTYYIMNGNTLGYINDAYPEMFGVLAGKVLLGGHDWIDGPVHVTLSDTLKPATISDFDFFRVCHKGHI